MAGYPTVSPGGRPINETPLSRSRNSNWVARRGGLPPYVRGVARGVAKRRHGGKVTSSDIKIAIGKMRKWRATSKNPAVKAASAEAIARWDAMKVGGSRGR